MLLYIITISKKSIAMNIHEAIDGRRRPMSDSVWMHPKIHSKTTGNTQIPASHLVTEKSWAARRRPITTKDVRPQSTDSTRPYCLSLRAWLHYQWQSAAKVQGQMWSLLYDHHHSAPRHGSASHTATTAWQVFISCQLALGNEWVKLWHIISHSGHGLQSQSYGCYWQF